MTNPPMHPVVEPMGDGALLVTVGETIDDATLARVRAVSAAIAALHLPAITDIVPAYRSVLVHYDPQRLPQDGPDADVVLMAAIADAATTAPVGVPTPGRLVEIPVHYGGDWGPDLHDVARGTGLPAEEVVRRHHAAEYQVHMLGFLPGFAFLGGLPPELATPRRSTPRTRVPAGAVGIGGAQTGVYPMESPGGWNLIGQSPLQLFDPARTPPALLAAGDRVRFRPITRDELETWSG